MNDVKELGASEWKVMIMLSSFVVFVAVIIAGYAHAQLAAQFGISEHAAQQIINIAAGGGSIWAIIAVVGGSAGWGAILLAAAKFLIKRYGKKAAVAW